MKGLYPIFKREILSYFRSPVAYVVIIIFLVAAAGCTFLLGNYFNSNQASLEIFFLFHPWLYLFLIPSIGMRLWSEERRSGTAELLLTLPVKTSTTVLAKFLAGWFFISITIFLTFPMIFTVYYLGNPDSGPILTGYLGSLLMAGSFLSISSFTSAITKNQVISFILSVIICLILVLSGWGVISEILNSFLPIYITDFISQFSFTTHFEAMRRGVVDLRDLVFFISIIVFMLIINILVIESKKNS